MKIITARTMLSLGLTLSFIFFIQTSYAQWIKQNIPQMDGLNKLQSVGKNVLWTANADRANLGLGIHLMHRPQFIRTENGGSTYSVGQLFPTDYYFIEPFDAKTAYLLGGSFSEPNYLFRRTTDGGLTWQDMPFTPPTYPGLVHFYDAKNGIYIGDPDNLGFYVASTTDSGKTFTRLSQSKLPQPLATEFTFGGDYQILDDNIFMTNYDFVANAWRIMRSTDRGKNWTAGAWISISNNYFDLRFAFTGANNGMVLRGIGQNSQKPLYTTDGGATWLESGNLPGLISYPIDNVPNTQNLMAFFQDTGRRILFTALTNDLGKTWNSFKDVGPYQLDTRYTQFGLTPFVNGQLEIVDNNTAWAEFTNFEIHRYESTTPLVPEKPDLDLTLKADNDGLPLYGYVKYTLTLTNRGISPATGVKVNWLPPFKRTPNGAGSYAFVSSYSDKGTYDSWNGIWTLDNLAAGSIATATFHLFVLDNSKSITQTAQVTACNERDIDSSPNNMSGAAKEDDEVGFVAQSNIADVANSYIQTELLEVAVSPNPAKDKLGVTVNPVKDFEWTVQLLNSLGQAVFSQKGQYAQRLDIDVKSLENGLYFVEYQSNGERKVEKVLIQH